VYAPTHRLPTFAVPLLLAVAVLGYLMGIRHVSGTRTSSPAPPDMQVASGSDVVLEYPLGWHQSPRGQGVPGLVPAQPLWLASSAAGQSAGLEAGSLPGTPASPLAPGLLARLHGLPKVEVVSLAALEALRYPDVRLAGYGQRLEIYAVPSPANGEAVLACHAPASAVALLDQCEQIVSSLSLAGQSTLDVTPDPVYARRLKALVAGVDGARRVSRARMSRAGDPRALASSSATLATRFVHGAGRLARLEAPPVAGAAQVVLARAMIAAGGAYSALGQAARAQRPARFHDARLRVQKAEQGVDRALENFALLGYSGRA
jgi:hypothetical protein